MFFPTLYCFLIVQATKTNECDGDHIYASCEWFKATIIQNCLSLIFGHLVWALQPTLGGLDDNAAGGGLSELVLMPPHHSH